jgi:acid stress-induced BolA-like protein IbaG/YrbA
MVTKSMHPQDVEKLIAEHIDCEKVQVEGEDRRHYAAVVVSPEFEGLPRIKRHQRVYQALGQHLENDIHALTLHTHTPAEFARLKSS